MNAITLPELEQAGIVASIADGKLRLSAPAGCLTAELRDRIARQRDTLLREVTRRQRQAAAGPRPHLLALANYEGLPATLVHGLDDADVVACAGYNDTELRGYLHALAAAERLDRGLPPLEWGEPVARICKGCGPVLLWAECPPVVAACPWCFRRRAGKPIARPREGYGRRLPLEPPRTRCTANWRQDHVHGPAGGGALKVWTDSGCRPAVHPCILAKSK